MKSRQDFATQTEYLNYLRAYYAGQAMQGFISAEADNSEENLAQITRKAVTVADLLVDALELNKGK